MATILFERPGQPFAALVFSRLSICFPMSLGEFLTQLPYPAKKESEQGAQAACNPNNKNEKPNKTHDDVCAGGRSHADACGSRGIPL